MSSQVIRTAVKSALEAAAAPWTVHDLSDYQELESINMGATTSTVLIQFVASDETMMNIAGEGNQGWEETGAATIHVLTPVGFDSGPILDKCDEIRLAMRGKRVDSVVMESCSPFTDFGGGSIGIEGAYKTFSASLFYYNRDCG